MFEYFSKPKNQPSFSNYGSFVLCRSGKSYKVNANVSIICENNPLLFDVGLNRYMLIVVEEALKSLRKKPSDVRYAVISHYHPDHIFNLLYIRHFFPNLRLIFHENTLKHITTLTKHLVERRKNSNNKVMNFFSHLGQFMEGSYITQKNRVYSCKDNDIIPKTENKLKIIHTPGHTSGEICLKDCTNRVLFLADHLPLTPWLDISENSIDDMISSIKRLLKISSKEVEVSVRGHGNLSDDSREIYPWEEEKERFEDHLELIISSIDRIIKFLKIKPRTIDELAYLILRNKDYRDYSSTMNFFFMPPNLSWIHSYLLKLRSENRIKRTGNKWMAV